MGVYIKGMEMPECCWDCDLCYDYFYCKGLEVQFSDREDFEPSERRLSDCPLVELPPHGRLIDADAMKVSLVFAEKTAEWAVPALRAVLMVIDEMPTIIPASEEHTMEEFMYGQEGNPNDGSM